MTSINEFESVFKAAAKPVFKADTISIKNVTIVIDTEFDAVGDFVERVEKFLQVLNSSSNEVAINRVAGNQFSDERQLVELIEEQEAGLICTYRNLHSGPNLYPYSLGEYVDVLTQATKVPILLVPRPEETEQWHLINSDRVMVMTDHLSGDSQIVMYGALFTQPQGELTLAHVEDLQTFERYMDVIGKIRSIDSDVARGEIMEQLLKEPRDFVLSCEKGLKEANIPITVKSVVTAGQHLFDYKNLIKQHETDLLVMHTKDDDQLAMHGLAYPVSVELRDIPLLLI